VGHLAAKDAYRALGRAVDGLTIRAPWSESFHAILRELYSPEEAQLVARMPTGLASIGRIRTVTGISPDRLQPLLESLAAKGLIMDLLVGAEWRFTVSPLVIGLFEYTMMRAGAGPDLHRLASLFHEYLSQPDGPFAANFSHGEQVSVMRTLPHEEAVSDDPSVEVLDYDSARGLVDDAAGTVVGICSCRHEKMHLGMPCGTAPLETCISFQDQSAYMTRRGFAREASKEEVRDLLDMARERRLVLNADNVRNGVSFICLCCGCCCNVLTGIRRFGLPNIVVSSGYIARCDERRCSGCGKCAAACPIEAVRMEPVPGRKPARLPRVDPSACIGCGVCGLACPPAAMRLDPRTRRKLLPENTIERVILQALERGTLQNFLIDNPNLSSQRFLRGVVGAFLALPPVKRMFMSTAFRSRFLSRFTTG
jgi:ferredoxin